MDTRSELRRSIDESMTELHILRSLTPEIETILGDEVLDETVEVLQDLDNPYSDLIWLSLRTPSIIPFRRSTSRVG